MFSAAAAWLGGMLTTSFSLLPPAYHGRHKNTKHRGAHSTFSLKYVVCVPRISLSQSVSQSVQLLSRVRLCATPWTAARQASLSITNSRSLLKLMSIESVTPSNHLILCCPLLLPPSIFPRITVFSNESILPIRWPKYRSFSFSTSPSNESSGLTSFRINWFDLLAVQGTLKSLLQHHNLKTSIFWCSAFFMVQLSTSVNEQIKPILFPRTS